MGYILGLDMGITSVGFGIIEEDTYNIIKYGVRLFDEGTADNNLQRRTLRSARRLKSRRRNRINAVKYLLLNNGIIDSVNFEIMNNTYELRVKGLTSKLTNIELANVLVNLAKRRGSSLDVAVDESNKDDVASASALAKNTSELLKRNIYVCEYQLEKLNNGEKLRNHENIFKSSDYEKELRKILSNQELDSDLCEKIVDIVMRRRNFAEGPGSEKFPTPYGSYREECVDGKTIIKHVNLIDEMRGKCSIFKNEPRIAKCTYEACLFNLLNDLNNIKIHDKEHITTEQKKEIISKFIEPKGKLSVAQLVKYLGVEEEELSGFRLTSAGKKQLTTFDGYVKMLQILPAEISNDKDKVDTIIDLLTKTLVVEERKKIINDLNYGLSEDVVEKLANVTKINGYHSLSKKAMDILIPELIESDKNQMQIIYANNLTVDDENLKGSNINIDDEAILSPVAKRVHRQTLRVVNELRKEYGEFSAIVIETTRAKNSAELKKQIQDDKNRMRQNKESTNQMLLDMDKNPDKYNTLTKLKVRLYKEQEGKTIYAGLPIDLDLLLNDPTAYQIEHIIPYAVSFDNSLNNKSLASAKENQDKGKRTPWQYFCSGRVGECEGSITEWDEYVAFVDGLKISANKKKNLLNQTDVTQFDNMKEFVSRNLNDTSYGIRTVMNTLKKYFSYNNISTNVFTVKGRFTNDFRTRVGLKKNRDFYIHHAIDALIIAGSKNQTVFNKAYNLYTKDDVTVVKQTGEVFDYSNDPFDDPRFLNFVSSLKNIEGKPEDFSYKVDKKTNRQLSDQTIYSTRNIDGDDYIIKKYKDIYGTEGVSLKKLFDDNKQDKLLMARNDEKTFELFCKIYESYKSEKNPFAKYKEENGPIRKYSKDGNGPIISQVKYVDKKLEEHYPISKNYNLTGSKKKVVLLQNSPYRTDIYQSKVTNEFKMVTVKRYLIKQVNGLNVIDEAEYKNLLDDKKIDDSFEFKFSLNRNDIVNLITNNDLKDNKDLKSRYLRTVGTNSDKRNVMEFYNIEKVTNNRIKITIGKSVAVFEKYNVSPTGKWSKVDKEVLKLKW